MTNTDKQKLIYTLNLSEEHFSITQILDVFLKLFSDEYDVFTFMEMRKLIEERLEYKIVKLHQANNIALEKATYLKSYLDGSMWKDEETAKRNVAPQIINAETIIDACGGNE